MRGGLARLLRDLRGALASLGQRWYVFGAQAVLFHGRPRFTADVDATIDGATADLPALVRVLRARGFELMVPATNNFLARTSVVPFVHQPTGLLLDVVVGRSGLEAGFLERAVPVRVGRTEILVISAGDLVVSKLLAGRPKDIEDVRGIIARQGRKLDVAHVRALLAEVERAVDQSDLRPLFDKLLKEARRRSLRRRA